MPSNCREEEIDILLTLINYDLIPEILFPRKTMSGS